MEMTAEQLLLERWRSLPPDDQAQVLQFVEFLHFSRAEPSLSACAPEPSHSSRADKLRALRTQIDAAGEPQLSWAEIDEELEARQGGSRGSVL